MHITKVTRGGQLRIWDTIRINAPYASVAKKDRESLSKIIERRKRAKKDARLVQILTR